MSKQILGQQKFFGSKKFVLAQKTTTTTTITIKIHDDDSVRRVCWRVKITRLLGGVADWAAGQGDCGGGARIHNYTGGDIQERRIMLN